MVTNKNLKGFYERVYVKGEKKHFTTFRESSDTSQLKLVLDNFNWKSKKILDVGCGTGYFAFNAAKKGGYVTGIDYSQKAISIAQSNYQHPNLYFKKIDIKNIVGKFDFIVCNGTLEHMDKPLQILKLFKKHLNPKGRIVITAPNWTNPRGYFLMVLFHLFNAPITLADLHYFTPNDFLNFSQKLKMKLVWKTFDRNWGHGTVLLNDFEKRIPNVLKDAKLPYNKKRIESFIKWIENNVVDFNNDLPHSGATGLYILKNN